MNGSVKKVNRLGSIFNIFINTFRPCKSNFIIKLHYLEEKLEKDSVALEMPLYMVYKLVCVCFVGVNTVRFGFIMSFQLKTNW